MKTDPTHTQPSTTRRDFVGLMALTAALPLGGLAPRAEAANAKKKGPAKKADAAAGPRDPMPIHLFSKPLQWLSYEEATALVAEAGYDGIDFTVRPDGHVLPERVEEDLPRAVEAARKAGLKTLLMTTGIKDAHDPHTAPILRTAAKLGIKFYRFGTFTYPPDADVWQTVQSFRPILKDLEAVNREHGLHGAFQNHPGMRLGSVAWDLFELLRELDPRHIGSQYDIRHATAEGGLSWPLGLRLLHPWVRCIDIKDFHWVQSPGKGTQENVPVGEGIVNYDQFFGLVRELKINGPISLHLEYPPFERVTNPLPGPERKKQFVAGMRHDLVALKASMAKNQIA